MKKEIIEYLAARKNRANLTDDKKSVYDFTREGCYFFLSFYCCFFFFCLSSTAMAKRKTQASISLELVKPET